MKTVTIILGEFEGSVEGDVIGVDYGAYVCARDGISMTQACGDFDSVTDEQMAMIQATGVPVAVLPAEKDDTDFYFAYKQCDAYASIRVLGGLGRRRDHEYINVVVAMGDSRVALLDGINCIKKYDAGHHTIMKEDYYYFSIVVIEPTCVTLEGFKYPLHKRSVSVGDTYLTSNEIVGDVGIMTLEGGGALVIQARREDGLS